MDIAMYLFRNLNQTMAAALEHFRSWWYNRRIAYTTFSRIYVVDKPEEVGEDEFPTTSEDLSTEKNIMN